MATTTEIRQQITNDIIAALSSDQLPPWRKPWSNDPNAPGLHTSLSTGNCYRGINQMILQLSAWKRKFTSKWWGTFKQIQANGGCVNRGQKATKIILWKPIDRKRTSEQGESIDDKFFVMREFAVFNASQTSGMEQFQIGYSQSESINERHYGDADEVIEAVGADIRYGGNQAFYSPSGDYIQMPFRRQFVKPEAYYETCFHELCHYSESRTGLDRAKPENSYDFLELVAEIGACFLMGELQMPTMENLENHAAYLKSWLKGMNDDPKFIFRAAAQSSKATDYILSFSRKDETIAETIEEPVCA
ncbi:ArdC family protein [Rosistilla oblonga]|uniref:DNA primase TraC n=1 Tax=Rosistilla oblonga TaxID=2527990 RepID=A0A518IT16_9BACT|nr:zincin-like metallopeptidase domain-containing protein [Rosistilla oblonga]QDV56244.1 DNA primase TraC [Rosistilla oblonga]